MILLNHHAMYICIHSFILACVHASITCIWLERIIINRCDLTLHFYDFLFYNFSIKLFVEEKSFLSRLISIGSLPLGRRQADDITSGDEDNKNPRLPTRYEQVRRATLANMRIKAVRESQQHQAVRRTKPCRRYSRGHTWTLHTVTQIKASRKWTT